MTPNVGMRAKVPVFAVSLFFSFALWLVVRMVSPPQAEVFPVEVVPTNKPERLTDPVILGTVMVRAETDGPEEFRRRQIERLRERKRVLALVDLRDALPGKRRYPLQLHAPADPVIRFSLLQSTVLVEMDERAERVFRVEVDTEGQLPAESKMMYAGAQVSPRSASALGPKAQVDQIQEIRAVLDLSQVQPGTESTVALEAVGKGGEVFPDVTIRPRLSTIRPRLQAAPDTKTVLVEPAFEGRPAPGFEIRSWDVRPNQVAVQAPEEALANLWKVETAPIRLEGLRDTASFEVTLRPPAGVRPFTARKVRVRVVIEPTNGNGSGR